MGPPSIRVAGTNTWERVVCLSPWPQKPVCLSRGERQCRGRLSCLAFAAWKRACSRNLKDIKLQLPASSLHLSPTCILGAFFYSTGLGMHDILSELQIFTEQRCLKNLADICLSILVIQERAGKDKVFENSQLAASSWLYGINRHSGHPLSTWIPPLPTRRSETGRSCLVSHCISFWLGHCLSDHNKFPNFWEINDSWSWPATELYRVMVMSLSSI